MKTLKFTSAVFLALIWGVCAWLAWPSGRAFSWVEDERATFVVSAQVDTSDGFPRVAAVEQDIRFTPQYLPLLRNALGEGTLAYSQVRTSSGSVEVSGSKLEAVDAFPYLGDYFEARGLVVAAGTLPQSQREVVLGHALARKLSPTGSFSQLLGQPLHFQTVAKHEDYLVVGVLAPSPRQNEGIDPDAGFARMLTPADLSIAEFSPFPVGMHLTVHPPPGGEAGAQDTLEKFVDELKGYRVVDIVAEDLGSEWAAGLRARLEERRGALLAFGLFLGAAALLTLLAHSFADLLRRRVLMGVDRALGATLRAQQVSLLGQQLKPAVPAALLGTAGLFGLPLLLPDIFPAQPPLGVILIAALGPPLALALLTALLAVSTLRESAYGMLRAAKPTQRLAHLFTLVYLGLGLGLIGAVSALTVWQHSRQQVMTLETRFSPLFSAETSTQGRDARREGALSLGSVSAGFGASDAVWATALPEVEQAAVFQSLAGKLTFQGKEVVTPKGMAGTQALPELLGLKLSRGRLGGCLLSAELFQKLQVPLGAQIQILGVGGPLPCTVTGELAPPDPLYPFLVASYPEWVAPPLAGIGPSIIGADGKLSYRNDEFRATGLLMALTPSATPEATAAQFSRFRPDLLGSFQVVPFAPDAEAVLTTLRRQAQVFLALALGACLLSIWGLVAGFVAILDASRFRIALDRSQGLTIKRAGVGWWLGHAGLVALCVAFALWGTALLASPLYNSFGLEVPTGDPGAVLPRAALLLPGGLEIVILGFLALSLPLLLALVGYRWLRSLPIAATLKEGA